MHEANMKHDAEKKIAFIIYEYGLGNSPSLINAAKYLVNKGFGVDFFLCGTFLGNVQFNDRCIHIHNIPDVNKPSLGTGFFSKVKWVVYYRMKSFLRFFPWKFQLKKEEKHIFESILFFVKSVKSIMGTTKYRCFIGVEPLGMMAAYQLSLQMITPFAYYNMELHIESDNVTPNDFIVKGIEKRFNKFASFTIAQDIERGRLIAKENGIQENSIIPVPVCADGEPFKGKTSYLRDMFGLSADTRIIIYAGYIADWAMCAEIAKSAQSWPKNWVLIFHTHGYNNENYIKKIRRFENSNLLFSLVPVPYEDLSAFLASADIGIALYKDLGANFTLISSASGKLAHYLKSGLPVVVNSYPGVSKVVNQYTCGIAIEDPGQLQEAISNIFENYQQMQSGAYKCYGDQYRFSRYFANVVDRIEQL
jgi:glycosyltransferase involved in cell wall biosynthesis